MGMLNFDPGQYDTPCYHQIRNATTDVYGGVEYPTFTNDGNIYYCQIIQTGSADFSIGNRIQQRTTATIRLKGWYASISELDRLQDLITGNTWIIDSLCQGSRQEDEWRITAHHL